MRKVIANEFMTLDGVVQAPSYADEDTTGEGPRVNFTPAGAPKMFPYAQGEAHALSVHEGKQF